ncbi:MAG: glycosyltransferase family 2 protein [Candidatus Eremiobacteraeota bacterium]|nr:glycosyltransferase family 2 protein [Candidatus Eremiobacteraeota bacterium]
MSTAPLITVQLCTYNRKALLGRVLRALFAQTLEPDRYEIVLVDDGSTDGTYEEVLRPLQPRCAFHLVRQRNAGLAAGRNAGIARARGEIILFMDDDVLATPGLLAAHARFHAEHANAICRGAVINVSSFEDLPPPVYSARHYSGAYFWTTNVSAPLQLVQAAGGFDERFREYGWEDLELGFRLRARGVRSILARDALVYHHKPPLQPAQFPHAARQARAQARTAILFLRKHPHWRIALATGLMRPHMWWSGLARRSGWPALLERIAAPAKPATRLPLGVRRWAAQRWARAAYYDELSRAGRSS